MTLTRTESEKADNLEAAEAGTSRVRVILQGSRRFATDGGGMMTPILEAGLRHDGGDAETGAGLELGVGLGYTDPDSGLSVEAHARALVAHADGDAREWGMGGSVTVAPDASGRGFSLSLAPGWGVDSGGAERLWSLRDARELTANDSVDPKSRLDGEAGYGLNGPGGVGVATPYPGLTLSGDDERAWRSGVRCQAGPDATLSLEGTRRESSGQGDSEYGLMLRAGMRW